VFRERVQTVRLAPRQDVRRRHAVALLRPLWLARRSLSSHATDNQPCKQTRNRHELRYDFGGMQLSGEFSGEQFDFHGFEQNPNPSFARANAEMARD